MTTIEVLQQCTVEGNVVKLPSVQLDRNEYLDVKKKLELIGGSWKGGKVSGFVFKEDPTDLLAEVAGGENRNIKKEFQFFATPDELADRLVELAQVEEGQRILEPSAGQGAIVKAINRATGGETVYCYELLPLNQTFLKKITTVALLGDDFLQHEGEEKFDRIIANPPFTKNQDIDHIKKMYSLLRKGGRLVSIASPSWTFGSQKKQVDFKEWLGEIGATVEELPAGAFKESGTNIKAMLIIINKAA